MVGLDFRVVLGLGLRAQCLGWIFDWFVEFCSFLELNEGRE